jgi:hypothetical protein
MLNSNYNPDVLTCVANLSSDEVFTPPRLANQILDMLPKEIWSDKSAKRCQEKKLINRHGVKNITIALTNIFPMPIILKIRPAGLKTIELIAFFLSKLQSPEVEGRARSFESPVIEQIICS